MDVLNLPKFKKITAQINDIENSVSKIYGIRYSLTSADPVCERVFSAAGKTAAVGIGTQVVVNDFDKIFPWSAMRLCNVSLTAWSTKKITYQGETGFALDGSNGDVMVEIPKHYVKRYQENGYEYVLISGEEHNGFSLDPSFLEGNVILDKIYVGRYNAYAGASSTDFLSQTGIYPTGSKSLAQWIGYAATKGTGYYILDWRTVMTIQRLFLVEFATRNSQSIMGGITRTVYFNKAECRAAITETGVNRIIITKGSQSEKFRLGQRVCVGATLTSSDSRLITDINDYSETQWEIIFDGAVKDITAGTTQICNLPQINGRTDAVVAKCGREAGDIDKTAFTYRGIENFYGNIWEAVADIKIIARVVYAAMSLGSTTFKNLSFKVPLQDILPADDSTVPYAKSMGFDALNPNIMLPEVIGTETVGADYWCDGFYSLDTESICVFGGGWDHYDRAGMFCWRFIYTPDSKEVLNGGRLIYKPI